MIQTFIALTVVALALVVVLWRTVKTLRRKPGERPDCGCGCGADCPSYRHCEAKK